MEAKGRESLYSTEKVLSRLVEKDGLYENYRKAMEEKGLAAEPMRYINENGRTVKADMSLEAVRQRRSEYEALRREKEKPLAKESGPEKSTERSIVSLKELSKEEKSSKIRMERREPMRAKEKQLQKGMER